MSPSWLQYFTPITFFLNSGTECIQENKRKTLHEKKFQGVHSFEGIRKRNLSIFYCMCRCDSQYKTTMVVRLHPGQSRRLSACVDKQVSQRRFQMSSLCRSISLPVTQQRILVEIVTRISPCRKPEIFFGIIYVSKITQMHDFCLCLYEWKTKLQSRWNLQPFVCLVYSGPDKHNGMHIRTPTAHPPFQQTVSSPFSQNKQPWILTLFVVFALCSDVMVFFLLLPYYLTSLDTM